MAARPHVVSLHKLTVVKDQHVPEDWASKVLTPARLAEIVKTVSALATSNSNRLAIPERNAIDAFATALVVGHIAAAFTDTNEGLALDVTRRAIIAEKSRAAAEALKDLRAALEINSDYPRVPTTRFPRGAASEPSCMAETLRTHLGVDRKARPRAGRRIDEAIWTVRRSERYLAQWGKALASSRGNSRRANVGKPVARANVAQLAKAWAAATHNPPAIGNDQVSRPFGRFATTLFELGNDPSGVINAGIKQALGETADQRAGAAQILAREGYLWPFSDKSDYDPCV